MVVAVAVAIAVEAEGEEAEGEEDERLCGSWRLWVEDMAMLGQRLWYALVIVSFLFLAL